MFGSDYIFFLFKSDFVGEPGVHFQGCIYGKPNVDGKYGDTLIHPKLSRYVFKQQNRFALQVVHPGTSLSKLHDTGPKAVDQWVFSNSGPWLPTPKCPSPWFWKRFPKMNQGTFLMSTPRTVRSWRNLANRWKTKLIIFVAFRRLTGESQDWETPKTWTDSYQKSHL